MIGAIAVFGGVFDPVHEGHLALARAALDELPVDRVVFLISGRPPHKEGRGGSRAEDRLRMLQLAVEKEPAFEVDDRELHRTGPSYTVDSLEEFATEHASETIYFLIGADNIRHLGGWYRAERILELCVPVVMPRRDGPTSFTTGDLPFLSSERIEALNRAVLRAVETRASSSEVRDRVARGASIRDLVPEAVREYIETRGLYRCSR